MKVATGKTRIRYALLLLLLSALALLLFPGVSQAENAAGGMTKTFLDLTPYRIVFLVVLGFVAGMVSGFIGSGGAFVISPGLMSLGVPGVVAVATNMCHKFPKALVGAYKRYRYGQVDRKMGIYLAVFAAAGAQVSIAVQKWILARFGTAGSNLFISSVFVLICASLGSFVLFDAWRIKAGKKQGDNYRLAELVGKITIPPVLNFKTARSRVTFWVTLPVGFLTGILAGIISVGGFVGVPGMVYLMGASTLVASATELVIAFGMGFTASITWAMGGFIDIRMVVLLLLGSLVGVQVGAVGTTYVKDYMVKVVMGSVMLLATISRFLAMPTYLHQLGKMALGKGAADLLNRFSFVSMVFALAVGGIIIAVSMYKGRKALPAAPVGPGVLPTRADA